MDFKEKVDFLCKSYSYLKSTIDHWINRAWNQFPGNKDIFESKLEGEVSKDFSNVEKQNEDVMLCQELRDVQLDQLSMAQFLDHPRLHEQSVVLINSNEVLEDHSIETSKILSHPIVSNQFYDPDAIISNTLGNPSRVCSNQALVIGESSTSIEGEGSYSINTKPSRPKRDLQPGLALCSPYHKKEVDTTERVSRLEERVTGSLFVAMCNPREKVYESANRFVGIRSVIESLIPGYRIHREQEASLVPINSGFEYIIESIYIDEDFQISMSLLLVPMFAPVQQAKYPWFHCQAKIPTNKTSTCYCNSGKFSSLNIVVKCLDTRIGTL
ncbi:unnamed protein product [Lactuca saligna]|uniref:Uncharacterized protein n=1 Tax=Lactuca saligna TaxID=75948 RepID=A0AA35YLW5_LACSI|nr:unnamed protein product [Lactuca saligna]